MTDTLRASDTVVTRTLERQGRILRPVVVILAILVLGLGAWVIYDFGQESALVPTSEIRELVDDYTAAWNEYDGEAFLATTRAGYTFTSNITGTFDRDEQLQFIENTLPASAWQVEMMEAPVMVGDTPWYYVSFPVQIEGTLRGSRQGVSVLAIYETLDGELLVMNHVYAGR
ncbi:MAG: hypothetical protein U9N56_05675 [Actinomycetota bacterium]|nr:hypothetical protein [Actinomycetota bacterium]